MFYITISNGLIKGDHRKRMGAAVWEFMWCIDKITRVDEQGFGWVLGSKPINLKDIADDMGVHENSVSANLIKLEEEGYIEKLITPHGIRIKVINAKKKFGKKGFTENSEGGSQKTVKGVTENSEPNIRHYNDNTVRQEIEAKASGTEDSEKILSQGAIENDLLDAFKGVNPNFEKLFANTNQRKAIKEMMKKFPADRLKAMIKYLPKSNASRFAPTITTPIQLQTDMGKLVAWAQKEKAKAGSKGKTLII